MIGHNTNDTKMSLSPQISAIVQTRPVVQPIDCRMLWSDVDPHQTRSSITGELSFLLTHAYIDIFLHTPLVFMSYLYIPSSTLAVRSYGFPSRSCCAMPDLDHGIILLS